MIRAPHVAATMLCCTAMLLLLWVPAHAECKDGTYACVKINQNGKLTSNIVGTVTVGNCWKWSEFSCSPCEGYAKVAETCNNYHYDQCKPDGCAACVRWGDTGGIAGPCYDYHGNKLCDGPPNF